MLGICTYIFLGYTREYLEYLRIFLKYIRTRNAGTMVSWQFNLLQIIIICLKIKSDLYIGNPLLRASYLRPLISSVNHNYYTIFILGFHLPTVLEVPRQSKEDQDG